MKMGQVQICCHVPAKWLLQLQCLAGRRKEKPTIDEKLRLGNEETNMP